MRAVLGILIALCLAGVARAGELSVTVRDKAGKPVRDVVVMVDAPPGYAGKPIRFDWPYRMAQKNIQFDPFVLIAPVGATVAFPNFDAVRHHVYSFSAPHPFEIKLYGRDETRSVKFDKPGVIAVGCNIHDQMLAYIRVVDTPFAVKSDAAGTGRLTGLPGGKVTLRLWHPLLRAPGNEVTRAVTLDASGRASQAFTVELQTPLRRHGY